MNPLSHTVQTVQTLKPNCELFCDLSFNLNSPKFPALSPEKYVNIGFCSMRSSNASNAFYTVLSHWMGNWTLVLDVNCMNVIYPTYWADISCSIFLHFLECLFTMSRQDSWRFSHSVYGLGSQWRGWQLQRRVRKREFAVNKNEHYSIWLLKIQHFLWLHCILVYWGLL